MKMNKSLDEVYGAELKRLRKLHKMKQPNLLEPLGLNSQQQISDLEKGKKHFNDVLVLNICKLFDISVLQFLNKPVEESKLNEMTGTDEYKEIERAEDNETKLILYKRLYLKTKIENIELKLKEIQPKKGKINHYPTRHKVHVII
jgi:transcriptional regulator with XRE-family HTH domain